MTRQIFRRLATVGLLGLASLLGGCRASMEVKRFNEPTSQYNFQVLTPEQISGCVDALKFQDRPEGFVTKKDRKAEPSQGAYFTGNASATYATSFVADDIVIGRGPVVQSQVEVARNDNLVKGDKILVGAFGNYDIKGGQINEADFNIQVTRPIYFMENIMGGYDNPKYGDFASVGYVFRQYPNGLEGTNDYGDHVLFASWLHSSRVDLKFDLSHLFDDGKTESGDLLRFTGSKKIKLGEIANGDLYIDPFVSTAYGINWYGINDFTAVTSGVTISHEQGPRVLAGKIQCQSSLNTNVKDVLYAGVGVGWKF